MNEILINYIVQAILGGASGYITNDFAINMLFKEYTPLKLGGVIKKTRNEFIENLSSMVENDIINKEKLNEIFNSDEFRVKFEKLTDDFYENCLYETVGSDTFADVDGFNSTLSRADIYVNEILNEHIGSLMSLIADNFNINYFITDIQSDKISNSVYKSINDYFENTKAVENALIYLYENNKNLKLASIINSNANIIHNSVEKFINIIADSALDTNIIDLAGFNDGLSETLDIFYDKQIKHIVNINNEEINTFIASVKDKGNDIIYKACHSLFSYGRNLNKSLYSLLEPAFEDSLKTYIEDNLPYVTHKAVNYVQKNSILIDRIIEDSIDEVINESQGIRAKLLSTIKNTYFNNLSKKYSIVDKLISLIEKSTEPEKLSINISTKIIEHLNNITISDIVKELENNGFSAEKAYDMVVDFINKNGTGIFNSAKNYISELHMRDILPTLNISAEKILSSHSVRNLLKNKSSDYIEALLSKELNNLIPEDKLDSFVNKAGSYLKVKFHENENTIKNLICDNIKQTHIDKDTLKGKTITEIIKKESYDKYKEEADKLKDIHLSVGLDKLNSIENISKNSSETLRTYMINNTDIILKGSIKGIVTDNLNKLSDDELVKFANDFIGRELKPIMFFGGILGVIAGLILAAFQNSYVNPNDISIATMLTYAFVGFITNVVAINMIFKPYKEIRILSKIPFLCNFSLGYIIKNQKKFANSTANYIDNSLLSKKSINELFEKHKNSIKKSFIISIGEKDSTFSRLLIKNKDNTIKGTYNFLKNKVLKNSRLISDYFYERVSQTKLSSIINEKIINGLTNLAHEKLENTKKSSNSIYKVISSDKKIKSSSNFFITLLNHYTVKFYNKLINYLKPDNFKKEIIKYEDKYKQYTNKNIHEVFDKAKLSSVFTKVNKIILSQNFRDNVSLAVVNLFNKSFDRNKTFGELFDGKIKTYIDKNLPQILKNMSDKVKDNLATSKKAVSSSVRAEFKNNLGFFEKGMFSFMGGDEIIDEILTKIMTDKIPKFMDAKKDEINSIITDLINEKFYKAKVEVLYTNLDKLEINEIVDNYFNINTEALENKINIIINELYNKVENKNLNQVLKFINMNDLSSLVACFEEEINTFSAVMNENLTKNHSFTDAVVEEFMNLNFIDIFNETTQDDIDRIIKSTTDILNKNDNFKSIVKSSIDGYKEYHCNIHLNYFIDRNEFISQAEKFVSNLLINNETEKTVKDILYSVLDSAAGSNFSFIDSHSKEYIVNKFVESSIETLRRNLNEVLKSVEFDRIASEEIEKMEPEKIHRMFKSFAEEYFRKLMLYGFGGFVFGINMYVGFALTGLKIFSEILKKDR